MLEKLSENKRCPKCLNDEFHSDDAGIVQCTKCEWTGMETDLKPSLKELELNEKMKIVSDGTPIGTSISYKGEVLPFVQSVDIKINAKDSSAEATVTFIVPKLDLSIEKGKIKAFMKDLGEDDSV